MGQVTLFWTVFWTAVGLLVAAAAAAAPAHAAATTQPDCHRSTSVEATVDDLRADPAGWICGPDKWKSDLPIIWLKMEPPSDLSGKPVTTLSVGLARIRSIGIHAFRDGAEISYRKYGEASVRQGTRGPFVAVALPEKALKPDVYYVRLEIAGHVASDAKAQLVSASEDAGWPFGHTLLVAAIFGLVCAPFLLNITLFPALRQNFMLHNAGMSLGMLMTLSAAGGLASVALPIDTTGLKTMLQFGYVLIVGCGGFFAANFLEEGALSPLVRKALIGSAVFVLVVGGGIALGLPAFAMMGTTTYFLSFFPMCLASLTAMAQAAQRRSLWVRYQIVGWTPAILIGLDMVAEGLGLQPQTLFEPIAPFLAMSFEVIVTGIGVAHRLILLRRERDDAQSEARVLEKLSERDPMTGLYNRRALEDRIEALHKSGHDTFALLDLDDFKQINDTAGHSIGDDVIRVAADVLQSDEGSLAIRVGGEEFMIVMQGADAAERAEKLRQSISLRVAREVPGLDRLVTASMGLAVIPYSAVPNSSFEDIFSLVDKLLYEAKEAGRNRTVSQRLRAFRKRSADRRGQAA